MKSIFITIFSVVLTISQLALNGNCAEGVSKQYESAYKKYISDYQKANKEDDENHVYGKKPPSNKKDMPYEKKGDKYVFKPYKKKEVMKDEHGKNHPDKHNKESDKKKKKHDHVEKKEKPDEYHKAYNGTSGYGKHEIPKGPLNCPNLKHCKKVKGLSKPVFQVRGGSDIICVYTSGNDSSCNLSASGSFCSLKGYYFGSEHVVSDKDGNTIVLGC